MNEVYISGAGCISAAGDGWRESAAGLYADAGVVPFPPSERIGSTLATPVFELTEFDPGNESKSMAFLHHALKEALDSAGLAAGVLRGKNVCVSIGTTVSCQLNNIPFYGKLRSGTVDSWEPLRNFFTSNPSERIRREYGLAGSALTVSNACVSGADAIALAYLNVASGACELAIAGGVDELNRVPIAGFNALGVASPEPCRPFDKKHTLDRSADSQRSLFSVPVPWAFTKAISEAESPARRRAVITARSSPRPSGCGAVI